MNNFSVLVALAFLSPLGAQAQTAFVESCIFTAELRSITTLAVLDGSANTADGPFERVAALTLLSGVDDGGRHADACEKHAADGNLRVLKLKHGDDLVAGAPLRLAYRRASTLTPDRTVSTIIWSRLEAE